MKRFNAFYARIVADKNKKVNQEAAIDKIYDHISKLINKGYDGCVMWQHQYPDILLNTRIAEYFDTQGFDASFDSKDLSLHISW